MVFLGFAFFAMFTGGALQIVLTMCAMLVMPLTLAFSPLTAFNAASPFPQRGSGASEAAVPTEQEQFKEYVQDSVSDEHSWQPSRLRWLRSESLEEKVEDIVPYRYDPENSYDPMPSY